MKIPVLVLLVCIVASCNQPKKQQKRVLRFSDLQKLKPLHKKLDEAEFGDWLYSHEETTETLAKYKAAKPHRPTENRKTIYIRPLGTFTTQEDSLILCTTEFLKAFYDLPVKLLPSVSDDIVPKKARRIHYGVKQFHTKTIMYGYLHKYFPDDAFVYLCLTNTDLYPSKKWNFVFGQANWGKHVAVASMARYKEDIWGDAADFKTVLERIMSTTAHETGHLLRLKHCATYHCLMNGSNNIEEADEKPSWLCPDCLIKLTWNLKSNVIQRYERLEAFYKKYGFESERVFCKQARKKLNFILKKASLNI